MKLDLDCLIKCPKNKNIIFRESEIDESGNQKEISKNMTIRDVIVICLTNLENTNDETILNQIELIASKTRENKSYLSLKDYSLLTFLRDLIKKDNQISNLIKAFVLSTIDKNI